MIVDINYGDTALLKEWSKKCKKDRKYLKDWLAENGDQNDCWVRLKNGQLFGLTDMVVRSERTISPFEAANRIATNIVLINGLKFIFSNGYYPKVQWLKVCTGNSHNRGLHDLQGYDLNNTKVLVGEAYHVVDAFNRRKENNCLKGLFKVANRGCEKIIVTNKDGNTPSRAQAGLTVYRKGRKVFDYIVVEGEVLKRI